MPELSLDVGPAQPPRLLPVTVGRGNPMYIGIGAVVVIILIVLLVLFLRRA
jgi:hypothetical protein